jgi:hypothetical protein
MADRAQKRIIELQRSLSVARAVLERIRYGTPHPEGVAERALDELFRLEPKKQLQGVCGHSHMGNIDG